MRLVGVRCVRNPLKSRIGGIGDIFINLINKNKMFVYRNSKYIIYKRTFKKYHLSHS